jgi:hypothetical protein
MAVIRRQESVSRSSAVTAPWPRWPGRKADGDCRLPTNFQSGDFAHHPPSSSRNRNTLVVAINVPPHLSSILWLTLSRDL